MWYMGVPVTMSDTPVEPVEPGYTTTEFWLTVATVLGATFTDIFHKNVPGGSQAIANGAAAIGTAVYTVMRTIRKN